MDAEQFRQFLEEHGACDEAVAWSRGKCLIEVWFQCARVDWLIWLVDRLSGEKGCAGPHQIILTSCDCVESVIGLSVKENRLFNYLEMIRKYVRSRDKSLLKLWLYVRLLFVYWKIIFQTRKYNVRVAVDKRLVVLMAVRSVLGDCLHMQKYWSPLEGTVWYTARACGYLNEPFSHEHYQESITRSLLLIKAHLCPPP